MTEALILAMVLVALMVRPIKNRRTTESEESSWSFAEPIRPLPREIAQHPRWRALVWSVTAIAVGRTAAGSAVPHRQRHLPALVSIAAVSVVTLSVTLLTGWSGQLSLGHWALAGAGAVMGSRLIDTYGVPFWLAFALAGVLGGVFALLLGIPALRLPGTLLAVVTLGFAVASEAWLFGQPFFKGPGRTRPAGLADDQRHLLLHPRLPRGHASSPCGRCRARGSAATWSPSATTPRRPLPSASPSSAPG